MALAPGFVARRSLPILTFRRRSSSAVSAAPAMAPARPRASDPRARDPCEPSDDSDSDDGLPLTTTACLRLSCTCHVRTASLPLGPCHPLPPAAWLHLERPWRTFGSAAHVMCVPPPSLSRPLPPCAVGCPAAPQAVIACLLLGCACHVRAASLPRGPCRPVLSAARLRLVRPWRAFGSAAHIMCAPPPPFAAPAALCRRLPGCASSGPAMACLRLGRACLMSCVRRQPCASRVVLCLSRPRASCVVRCLSQPYASCVVRCLSRPRASCVVRCLSPPHASCAASLSHTPLASCAASLSHTPLASCAASLGHTRLASCAASLGHAPLA
ncbi:hypothetical protein OAO87_01145, partial [bacterium]|nr:hypothetical protein [bacterium]